MNSKKSLLKIIVVFTVTMLAFAFGGKVMSVLSPADSTPPTVDLSGAYGAAKADFEKNGMKGIWISYIELQNVNFSTKESFTADITEMFDNCKNMGLNTVIVHVRSFGDAYYNSSFFPYSHIMTGTQGQNPGFDPLEIMVETAHTIGLRFEAWINPYRVKLYNHPKELSVDNPAKNTALTISTDSGVFYNPAMREVRDLVTNGVIEIIQNYNVDGIHFDDYFYPDTAVELDKKDYSAYNGNLPLEDWRRENVNMLVRQVYSAIKQYDESITFGISPQGNDDNNYHMQYSDVKLWMSEEGYTDYIMPQLYWGFDYLTKGGSDRYGFKNLSYEWSQYKKLNNVQLYIGLGAYRIGTGDGGANQQDEWSNGHNLADMITVINANPDLQGYALYSYNSLFDTSEYGQLKNSEVESITNINNK